MHYQTFTHTVRTTGAGLQRRFVSFDGAQAAANSSVLGVAKTDFAAGQDLAVDYLGVVAVEAGGAIALGAGVTPDAQGRAVADPTADNGVAANRVGRALSAVTAAGQTVIVLLLPLASQTLAHTLVGSGTGVRNRFVTLAGAQAVANSIVFGVARSDFVAAQPFLVDYLGVVAVEAGAAIAQGAGVTPDAQGRAVTDPTADNGVAANRVGRAMTAVTAAGQTVFVLIR